MITKDMSITEIIQKYPQVIEVFQTFGLGWLGCIAATFETLEQGAQAHGIDVNELVNKLNQKLSE